MPRVSQRSMEPWPAGRASRAGFTTVEMLSVLAIIAILTAIAIGTSVRVSESRRVKEATADILEIQALIDEYILENEELPVSLGAAGAGGYADPWGRPYRFLPFNSKENVLNARMDRYLHPLNTYYDLYSVGADGTTAKSIAAGVSRDDVVRANDGAYIGLAAAY